jgi:hypothetical protein
MGVSQTYRRHKLREFENRVLKRDEVTGGWRKLNNDELRDLYSSPSVIRMIKSRRMRCMEHAVRIGRKAREKTTRKTKT